MVTICPWGPNFLNHLSMGLNWLGTVCQEGPINLGTHCGGLNVRGPYALGTKCVTASIFCNFTSSSVQNKN